MSTMQELTEVKKLKLYDFLVEVMSILTPLSFETKLALNQVAKAITCAELMLDRKFDSDKVLVERQLVDSQKAIAAKLLNATITFQEYPDCSIFMSGAVNNGRLHRFNVVCINTCS